MPWIGRAVFKWLSKNQNQSNYSDQSQQEQTAPWTNHNSYQLPVTRSKRGKNHAYMVRLVLVLLLIDWKNWRDSFKAITKRSNRNPVITFDSHLKTALSRPNVNSLLFNRVKVWLALVFNEENCRQQRYQRGDTLIAKPTSKLVAILIKVGEVQEWI